MRTLATGLVVFFLACAPEAASSPQPGTAQPVLLELFTSQGCSSCPPADQLLTRLGKAGTVAGVPVIPLAFHVDYWNRLGWKDPFSAARWSARQQRYARAVAGGRVYTPQLVVNGRTHVVGSRRGRVAAAVKQQAKGIRVAVRAALAIARGRATVRVRTARPRRGKNVELVVALYENGLLTTVPRGENAGRRLRNDYVVRALRVVPLARDKTVTFRLARTWDAKNLGAVAWLRDASSQAVLGVARASR